MFTLNAQYHDCIIKCVLATWNYELVLMSMTHV